LDLAARPEKRSLHFGQEPLCRIARIRRIGDGPSNDEKVGAGENRFCGGGSAFLIVPRIVFGTYAWSYY
jgi:hypothetical protein